MAQERSPRYNEQMVSGKVGQEYTYAQLKSLEMPYKKLGRNESREDTYSPFQRAVIMRGMKLFSVVVTVLLFAAFWTTLYPENNANRFGADFIAFTELATKVLYGILIIELGRIYRAYEAGISRISEIVYSQTLANFIGGAIIYILTCLTRQDVMNPLPLLVLVLAQGIWSVVWSSVTNKLYFQLYPPQKTVIICKQAADLRKIEQIRFFPNRFNLQKQIEDPTEIDAIIREIDENKVVFIIGIDSSLRNKIINYCLEEGIQSYVVPQVGDVVMAGAEHMQMFSTPIMRVNRASLAPEYLFIKRAFDIVGSVLGIFIASPFMMLTALAIKAYDGGPILYKQVRLTQGRHEFMILKFRSMCVDAEKDGVARLAGACDDRITPVGRIIRAIRFDELPQLFNILRGDMAIVGPRPERPEIAKQYERDIPEFVLRLHVKAGLTGYAQVYGKYSTEPDDKLQMDLMYINNMSILEDLRLIFATIKVLFMRESTSGVEVGQTTAARQKKEKSA